MKSLKQKKNTQPQVSLTRELEIDPNYRVFGTNESPRIIMLGYKSRKIAKARRRIFRNQIVEPYTVRKNGEDVTTMLSKKEIIAQHRQSLRDAGVNPSKQLNIESNG